MLQCSGATGIPRRVLEDAKAKACPAFVAHRIRLEEFLRWFFDPARSSATTESAADGDSDADLLRPVNGTWQESRARVATHREVVRLAHDKRQLLDRAEVQRGISRGMAQLFGDLDRIFTAEFPARAKGRDEREIRVMAQNEIEALKAALRERWGSITETDQTPVEMENEPQTPA